MFLEIYYKLLAIEAVRKMTSLSYASNLNYKTANGAIRTTFKELSRTGILLGKIISQETSIAWNQWNIIVGSGTTPVTQDDYKVEEEITTLKFSSADTSQYDLEAGWIRLNKTMENTSNNPITINEIGLTTSCDYNVTGSYPQLLIYREVLAEPIVVQPGEPFTVSITVQFPTTA